MDSDKTYTDEMDIAVEIHTVTPKGRVLPKGWEKYTMEIPQELKIADADEFFLKELDEDKL